MNERHPGLPDDPQTRRTRVELWIIFAVVIVVLAGSLGWRAIGHHRGAPEISSRPPGSPNTPPAAAAGAGVPAHSLP